MVMRVRDVSWEEDKNEEREDQDFLLKLFPANPEVWRVFVVDAVSVFVSCDMLRWDCLGV